MEIDKFNAQRLVYLKAIRKVQTKTRALQEEYKAHMLECPHDVKTIVVNSGGGYNERSWTQRVLVCAICNKKLEEGVVSYGYYSAIRYS